MRPHIALIEGANAYVFNKKNNDDPDLDEKEKRIRWNRFYWDAADADDDTFYSKWPDAIVPLSEA